MTESITTTTTRATVAAADTASGQPRDRKTRNNCGELIRTEAGRWVSVDHDELGVLLAQRRVRTVEFVADVAGEVTPRAELQARALDESVR